MGVSYYRICEKSEEKNKDLSLRPQAREFFPPEYLLLMMNTIVYII